MTALQAQPAAAPCVHCGSTRHAAYRDRLRSSRCAAGDCLGVGDDAAGWRLRAVRGLLDREPEDCTRYKALSRQRSVRCKAAAFGQARSLDLTLSRAPISSRGRTDCCADKRGQGRALWARRRPFHTLRGPEPGVCSTSTQHAEAVPVQSLASLRSARAECGSAVVLHGERLWRCTASPT